MVGPIGPIGFQTCPGGEERRPYLFKDPPFPGSGYTWVPGIPASWAPGLELHTLVSAATGEAITHLDEVPDQTYEEHKLVRNLDLLTCKQ